MTCLVFWAIVSTSMTSFGLTNQAYNHKVFSFDGGSVQITFRWQLFKDFLHCLCIPMTVHCTAVARRHGNMTEATVKYITYSFENRSYDIRTCSILPIKTNRTWELTCRRYQRQEHCLHVSVNPEFLSWTSQCLTNGVQIYTELNYTSLIGEMIKTGSCSTDLASSTTTPGSTFEYPSISTHCSQASVSTIAARKINHPNVTDEFERCRDVKNDLSLTEANSSSESSKSPDTNTPLVIGLVFGTLGCILTVVITAVVLRKRRLMSKCCTSDGADNSGREAVHDKTELQCTSTTGGLSHDRNVSDTDAMEAGNDNRGYTIYDQNTEQDYVNTQARTLENDPHVYLNEAECQPVFMDIKEKEAHFYGNQSDLTSSQIHLKEGSCIAGYLKGNDLNKSELAPVALNRKSSKIFTICIDNQHQNSEYSTANPSERNDKMTYNGNSDPAILNPNTYSSLGQPLKNILSPYSMLLDGTNAARGSVEPETSNVQSVYYILEECSYNE
ncbi:unnamed protein product [Lymnaea stagnalis]|uniref:Uncharacterized protein n=1 Tax=Lymnaea stagnalis TaxID=6523 RepID=A0AAV2H554_LYMST